jgi:hypothetical protein
MDLDPWFAVFCGVPMDTLAVLWPVEGSIMGLWFAALGADWCRKLGPQVQMTWADADAELLAPEECNNSQGSSGKRRESTNDE